MVIPIHTEEPDLLYSLDLPPEISIVIPNKGEEIIV
jgi:hypothetical protein